MNEQLVVTSQGRRNITPHQDLGISDERVFELINKVEEILTKEPTLTFTAIASIVSKEVSNANELLFLGIIVGSMGTSKAMENLLMGGTLEIISRNVNNSIPEDVLDGMPVVRKGGMA
jgi:hypothetical protein